MQWQEKYQEYREQLEAALPGFLPSADGPQGRVSQAMAYSLLGGGKRIRACLLMATCELCGGTPEMALPFAAAVEMIHAYSLIHDDLPCMDDDSLRRGKPSCHVQFDEATALLAGDALLTHAFDVMLGGYYSGKIPADRVLRAVHTLSISAGVQGMIGGQMIDIEHENQELTPQLMEEMDHLKTGALLQASAAIGCTIAGASESVIIAAGCYAKNVGLAFQIIDDILDATKTSEELGKSASDEENDKTTYFTAYGEDKAREMVHKLVLDADLAIKGTVLDDPLLYELADALSKREI